MQKSASAIRAFCFAVRIDNDNNKFLFEVIRTDLPVLFGVLSVMRRVLCECK